MAATILLLDDDRDIRTMLGSILESDGHRVIPCARIREARQILVDVQPTLLVLDGLLPDGNGFEFLAELRAAGVQTPVILLSHAARNSSRFRGLVGRLGSALVLRKPINPYEFLVHSRSVLGIDEEVEEPTEPPLSPQQKQAHGLHEDDFDTDANLDAVRLVEQSGFADFHRDGPPVVLVKGLDDVLNDGTPAIFDSSDSAQIALQKEVPVEADLRRRKVHQKLEMSLARMRRTYAGRLESRLEALEDLLEKARQEPSIRENVSEAHAAAHRLHGSAGTYGFSAVGFEIGNVEKELLRFLDYEVDASDQEVWQRIEEAMKNAAADAATGIKTAFSAVSDERYVPTVGTVVVLADQLEYLQRVEAAAVNEPVHVLTARSPEILASLIGAAEADCVLVDPHLGGDPDPGRVVRRIRSVPGFEGMPVAFFRRNADIPDRTAAISAGASRFITGDLSGAELTALVRDLGALRPRRRSRILVIEDDIQSARHVERLLRDAGLDVYVSDQATQIFQLVEELQPDALIIDCMMPVVSGLQVCSMLRASRDWQDLPILLVTADPSIEMRVAAFEAGADDYLSLPILPAELSARLRVRLERRLLARERATRDGLTSLLRRHSFIEAFESRLADTRRTKRPLSLVLMRLRDFDRLAEQRGYAFADRVLAALGHLLRAGFRAEDLRCHWDTSEFAVVLVGTEAALAHEVMDRTRTDCSLLRLENKGKVEEVALKFDLAIAGFPNDGTGIHELFAGAKRSFLPPPLED